MKHLLAAAAATAALALAPDALGTAQQAIPARLAEMADAERAFAAAARVKGIRDAFLEFFADDAIALEPGPVKAKDGLLKQPSRPFSAHELTWEPRTGDVAASGELGWLTGPSTFVDRETSGGTPRFGNYLSVWRRQADGRWRVFIDIGTAVPRPASFAPGFVRFAMPSRYTGDEPSAAARDRLLATDRALNERLASDPASGYADRLAESARYHRSGNEPLVGRDLITGWLRRNVKSMVAESAEAEAAASSDFGITYGTHRPSSGSARGAYLRVWTRDARGEWLIAADVATPPSRRP